MKNFKMELLNSEELKNLKGGTNEFEKKGCTGSGDTIIKNCIPVVGDITIIWCQTLEAKCSGAKPQFTPCTNGVTSTCGEGTQFTLTPK
jgi:hypothetical protein